MAPAPGPRAAGTIVVGRRVDQGRGRGHGRPQRAEQLVPGGRDPAADHHPLRPQHGDQVGDPHGEAAHGLPDRGRGPLVAGRGRGEHRLGGVAAPGPAEGGPGRERLDTAPVAAAAAGPVDLDDLVAELAGPARGAEAQAPVDDHPAPDPGPEGQADHRRAAGGRPHPALGQGEGPGVVDQGHRHAQAAGQRVPERLAGPGGRQVGQEHDPPRGLVEQPGHAHPGGHHRPVPGHQLGPGGGQPAHHLARVAGAGRDRRRGQQAGRSVARPRGRPACCWSRRRRCRGSARSPALPRLEVVDDGGGGGGPAPVHAGVQALDQQVEGADAPGRLDLDPLATRWPASAAGRPWSSPTARTRSRS